jgi:hypothetical protein
VVLTALVGLAAGTPSVFLHTIDPETLADVDGASALEAEAGACGVGPVVRGRGNWGVVVQKRHNVSWTTLYKWRFTVEVAADRLRGLELGPRSRPGCAG